MNIIAAVDRNWGIGYQNRLLFSIPEDMKFFREMTTGNVVVMGRKTLESFPHKKPLKNRVNIVLTGDPCWQAEGAVVVHSVEEALSAVSGYASENVYVIGGESVYRQFLPHCDTAHITYMDHAFRADTYFPDLDDDPEWEISAESEKRTFNDVEYCFRTYARKKK